MFRRQKRPTLRIFFATDVHGSDACFRKFVNAAVAYSADAIILGGDITGKQVAMIVEDNGGWRIGEDRAADRLETTDALVATQRRLHAVGMYSVVVTVEEEE